MLDKFKDECGVFGIFVRSSSAIAKVYAHSGSRINGEMADDDRAARLGEIIRRQRELGDLSMRQFADLAGISNPYLSQIERGLREPSEKVLDAIATSLQSTAGALREQAGLAAEDEAEPETAAVVEAIRADPALSARQRQALLEVYRAFIVAGPAPARRGR